MKNAKAISLSAIISIAVLTLMIIIGELAAPFKDALKALTGHHWVTKSVVTFVIYIILWLILSKAVRKDNQNSAKYIWWVTGTTIISSVVIMFFYTLHHLSLV